jgi:hypothetical protein
VLVVFFIGTYQMKTPAKSKANLRKTTLDVTLNGESHTLLMTYGLLNKLATQVSDVEDVTNMGFSAENREATLLAVLTRKGKTGCFDEVDLDEIEEIDEIERVLDWASDHVFDFFMKRLRKAQEGLTKLSAEAETMTDSLEQLTPGSEA